MSYLTKAIGVNIKKARLKLGLNQQALADKAEITQAALCYLEQGERNPSISALERLAKVLDVPVSILVKLKSGKDSKNEYMELSILTTNGLQPVKILRSSYHEIVHRTIVNIIAGRNPAELDIQVAISNFLREEVKL